MKYLFITVSIMLLSISLFGCSKQYVPVKHTCLPDPPIFKVEVKNGMIDKKNTKNVIHNHITAWKYIEYLKLKGCK